MDKYQKIIDYDKHEAHYYCKEYGIVMEVSKDIIIDELQQRIDKAIEYIKFNLNKNEELIEYFNWDGNFNKLLEILKGE